MIQTFQHQMPFGATPLRDADGRPAGVRFRLWAPSAVSVALHLEPDGDTPARLLPMTCGADGWAEITVAEAGPGTLYRYRIDDRLLVPDPASRHNPDDAHGPSEVMDPLAFGWTGRWTGRPWREAVIYELHVGTFTPEGTFDAAAGHLGHLRDLGITAIELMPVAEFPGRRNWGYDGVLPYAPDAVYGRPDSLKRFVQRAHDHGLMVLLDVVYNHFGPSGNYLGIYAARFFNEALQTPWGAAINMDAEQAHVVRDYFIHNALYWLEEFQFDGLRFDAVHAIRDRSPRHVLADIATRIHEGIDPARRIHLILENEANEAHWLAPGSGALRGYDAQWNDDLHHAAHVLASDETDGYYADYDRYPGGAIAALGRCLTEGFAFQGEPSPWRAGHPRGQASRHVPLSAFVNFLQNHDQIGNRAMGERLVTLADRATLRALAAVVLLAPSPPMLFMGEEFDATTPFLFFADHEPELARAIVEGRRREFGGFDRFASAEARDAIPDPCAPATFEASRLDWREAASPAGREALEFHRCLLALRQAVIVPLIPELVPEGHRFECSADRVLRVRWAVLGDRTLECVLNLGTTTIDAPQLATEVMFAHGPAGPDRLGPCSVRWSLSPLRPTLR